MNRSINCAIYFALTCILAHLMTSPNTPNSSGIEVVDVLNCKPATSLKRSKIGPWLLLMTNRKSHTRFRLVRKSTTLDELEGPLRTLFQNACCYGAHHEDLNDDRATSTAKMEPNDCSFWQCGYSRGFLKRGCQTIVG